MKNTPNSFHFLRFLAASLVLYGHSYPLTGRGTFDALQLLSQGLFPTAHMGVCIFLVISGYLIAQSLENSPTAVAFLYKRILRIFPGLIIASVVTVVIIGAIATQLPANEYFSNADTFRYFKVIKLFPFYPDHLPGVFEQLPIAGQVNGSLWTLAYEFLYYLILLAVFIFFSFRQRLIYPLTLLAAWVVVCLVGERLQGAIRVVPMLHLSYFATFDFGLYFLAGVVAYVYRDKIKYRLGYFLLAIGLWIGVYVLTRFFPAIPLRYIVLVRYLCLPYLVLYIAFLKSPLNQFSRWGDYSYGMYIYGFPVQQLIVHFLGTSITIEAMIALSFLAVVPLAWLSWHFVENPALKLKKLL